MRIRELVHVDDGSIDTPRASSASDPYHGYYTTPGQMNVTNINLMSRDVYFQVVATQLSGVDMGDSTAVFRLESVYGNYPVDTNFYTYAYKKGLPSEIAAKGGLSVSTPFPNPLSSW